MNIGESNAANVVARVLSGQPDPATGETYDREKVQVAVDLLLKGAHRALAAGLAPGQATVQLPRTPEVIVIENPQADPTWKTFGDVKITTMSSYPWSQWSDDDETREATQDYLQILRDGTGDPAYLAWLREWLETEVEDWQGGSNRPFTVDWTTLTINDRS